MAGKFDFGEIARITPGFVGADLTALAKEAGTVAVRRLFGEISKFFASKSKKMTIENGENSHHSENSSENSVQMEIPPEELKKLEITMQDFKKAVKRVQPSAKREG